MRGLAKLVFATVAASMPSAVDAKVRITVNLASQSMHVVADDRVFDWKVSSGKAGYETPAGSYRVLWMDKDHLSDEYDGVPMPNAIFFKPGFAIHGAARSPFGRPASHGCVRLPVAQSAMLFDLVQADGAAEIRISGATPMTASAGGHRRHHAVKRANPDGDLYSKAY